MLLILRHVGCLNNGHPAAACAIMRDDDDDGGASGLTCVTDGRSAFRSDVKSPEAATTPQHPRWAVELRCCLPWSAAVQRDVPSSTLLSLFLRGVR